LNLSEISQQFKQDTVNGLIFGKILSELILSLNLKVIDHFTGCLKKMAVAQISQIINYEIWIDEC
jgi:phage-related holin